MKNCLMIRYAQRLGKFTIHCIKIFITQQKVTFILKKDATTCNNDKEGDHWFLLKVLNLRASIIFPPGQKQLYYLGNLANF